jgi:23S rRNA (uracil1939-C5)-methyltransferase
LHLTIEKLIYGGDGLARLPADASAGSPPRARVGAGVPESGAGKAVFVPFVIPGERVEAAIVEQKPGFARARLEHVIEPSPQRVPPPCPYFYECGGCQHQHIGYEDQLRFKTDILRETLRRTAKIDLTDIIAHPSPPWNYRNRTRMRVHTEPEFAIGYNRFGSRELLPVRECPISSRLINRVLAELWQQGEAGHVPQGVVQMEFFANAEDSELLLEVTLDGRHARRNLRQLAAFARELRAALPEVAGIVPFELEAALTQVRLDVSEEQQHELGCEALLYRTPTAQYQVSAGSFFQTNRLLTDEMVALVTEGKTGDYAADLYAGVGLFSLPLSQNFLEVAAVEPAHFSFHDLKRNSPSNVLGYRVTTEKFLANLPEGTRFDYIVADPPRGGLGEKVALVLAALKAPQITYVSCDPATLARDLRVIMQSGYRVTAAHLLDLFPQTFHIETVLELAL